MNLELQLELELKREVLSTNYYQFFLQSFKWLHNDQNIVERPHIKYLCDLLQSEHERVLRKEEKNKDYIVNIPPRSSKSLIVNVCFLPFVWLTNPAATFICVSFDQQLSLINSQFCHDIITHPEFQELFSDRFQLRKDIDSKTHFANNKGGYRITRTTGQNVTGMSCLFCMIDDADSAMSAESKNERDFVHSYYSNALYNRLTPAQLGVRFIIAQRLHQADLTGYLLESNPDNYEHICLPAEYSSYVNPQELKYCYTNGLLDPSRLGQKLLQVYKNTLLNRYSGQYAQRPVAAEGGIFKKEWFEVVEPQTLSRDIINEPIHWFIDTAYTEKQQNDPTGILTCFKKGNFIYILDATEQWLEFPQLCEFIKSYTNTFQYSNNSKLFIEPKASGKSVIQQLRQSTQLNVIEIKAPKDSKVTRANSVTATCASMRVKLVNGPYINKFLDQITTFPFSLHDEFVDTLVYSIQELLLTNGPDYVFL